MIMKIPGFLWEAYVPLCLLDKAKHIQQKVFRQHCIKCHVELLFQAGPFKFRMHLYLADNKIIASAVKPDTE